VISKRLSIFFFFFYVATVVGNPFLPLFNKLYKTHQLVESKKFSEAKKSIFILKSKKDSTECILWYDLTRIYLSENKFDSAFIISDKALSVAIQQFQNEGKSKQIAKRYHISLNNFDSLFAQQVEKAYLTNRNTNPDKIATNGSGLTQKEINQQFIRLFKTKLNFFQFRDSILKKPGVSQNPSFSPKCISLLEKYIFHLELTQDTLNFHSVIQTNSIAAYKNYLKTYWSNIDSKTQLNFQIHQLNFFKVMEDSLYNLAYINTLKTNTENAFLLFIKEYPRAPQKDSALNHAESIAYLEAKSVNNEVQYNYYLSKYPKAIHKAQVEYLLRYLNVIPVPYLTKDLKYVFVDSASSETWSDSSYDFAYPYASKYHKKWYDNGSMLMPGCALVMKLDAFETPEFYYVEKDGSRVNKNNYDEIIQFTPNMAFVLKAERYGIINSLGNEVLPCKFQRIYFDTSLGIGAVFNGKFWGFINIAGKLITPLHYNGILTSKLTFTVNADIIELPKLLIPVSLNNLWGYIEANGQVAIDYKYKQAYSFKNGVALIESIDSKWFYINRFGDVVSKEYENIQDLENGFSKITKIIDGKKKIGILAKPFRGFVQQLNTNSKQLNELAAQFNLSLTPENLRAEFKEIIPPIHEEVWYTVNEFFTGYAVKQKTGFTLYDTAGKMINKNPIPNINIQSQKLFITKEKKQLKWFNPNTKTMSTNAVDEISILTDNLIGGLNKGVWNFYSIDESIITITNDKGTIFKDFEAIAPAEKEGYIIAQKKGLWGLIHQKGNFSLDFILDFKFLDIYFTDVTNQYIVRIPVQGNPEESTWGVYNGLTNKYIIEPVFDGISYEDFSGYWLVPFNEKNAWLDSKGNLFAE
jgi:hypothetical protein